MDVVTEHYSYYPKCCHSQDPLSLPLLPLPLLSFPPHSLSPYPFLPPSLTSLSLCLPPPQAHNEELLCASHNQRHKMK